MGRPSHKEKSSVASQVKELRSTIGDITMEAQIAQASKFNAELNKSEEGKIREKAWEAHLTKSCDRQRVWAEILIFRATGRSSFYFIAQNKEEDILETGALDELSHCAVAFARILIEGRLPELEDIGQLHIDCRSAATIAEKFKTYLDAFQAKKLFEIWDYLHILDLRRDIFRVLHKEQKKRTLSLNTEEPSPSKKISIELYESIENHDAEPETETFSFGATSNCPSPQPPCHSPHNGPPPPCLSFRPRKQLDLERSNPQTPEPPSEISPVQDNPCEICRDQVNDKPESLFVRVLRESLAKGRAARDKVEQARLDYETMQALVTDSYKKLGILFIAQGRVEECADAIQKGREKGNSWEEIYTTFQEDVAKRWGESGGRTALMLGHFSLLVEENKTKEALDEAVATYGALRGGMESHKKRYFPCGHGVPAGQTS